MEQLFILSSTLSVYDRQNKRREDKWIECGIEEKLMEFHFSFFVDGIFRRPIELTRRMRWLFMHIKYENAFRGTNKTYTRPLAYTQRYHIISYIRSKCPWSGLCDKQRYEVWLMYNAICSCLCVARAFHRCNVAQLHRCVANVELIDDISFDYKNAIIIPPFSMYRERERDAMERRHDARATLENIDADCWIIQSPNNNKKWE